MEDYTASLWDNQMKPLHHPNPYPPLFPCPNTSSAPPTFPHPEKTKSCKMVGTKEIATYETYIPVLKKIKKGEKL